MAAPTAAAGSGSAQLLERSTSQWWVWVPVPVTLLVTLLAPLSRPVWMDEAWTIFASRLSPEELLRLVQNYEAVSGTYYLISGLWATVMGDSLQAARALSVAAVTVAAAAVVALGLRLAAAGTAAVAGLIFAVLPAVSWYGTEARPYAVVLALTTWSTYMLIRADASGWRIGAQTGYIVLLTASAYVQIFTLVVAAAHTGALLLARSGRQRVAAQLTSALVAVLLASPVILGISRQNGGSRGYLSFALREPTFYGDALVAPIAPRTSWLALVAVVVLLAAAVVGLRAVPRDDSRNSGLTLTAVCLPWIVMPVTALLVTSTLTWQAFPRHLVLVIPPVVLLAASGLLAMPRRAAVALAVVLLTGVVVLQAHLHSLSPEDFWDTKREVLEQHVRPGDGVVAQDHVYALLPVTDPIEGLVPLQDMKQLFVEARPVSEFEQSLATSLSSMARVWLVSYDERASNNDPSFTALLEGQGLCLQASYDGGNSPVSLFVRCERRSP